MADFVCLVAIYNLIFVNKIVCFQKNENPGTTFKTTPIGTNVLEKLHLTRKKEQALKKHFKHDKL